VGLKKKKHFGILKEIYYKHTGKHSSSVSSFESSGLPSFQDKCRYPHAIAAAKKFKKKGKGKKRKIKNNPQFFFSF
jgi:hypothetical protein